MRRVTCHPHYAHVMFPYKSWIGLLCGIAVELQAGRDKEHKCLCVCVCEWVFEWRTQRSVVTAACLLCFTHFCAAPALLDSMFSAMRVQWKAAEHNDTNFSSLPNISVDALKYTGGTICAHALREAYMGMHGVTFSHRKPTEKEKKSERTVQMANIHNLGLVVITPDVEGSKAKYKDTCFHIHRERKRAIDATDLWIRGLLL